ncbi:hypothetical protein N7453_003240 [Penicillium expansum]|nr:hypothetical protein N7453_003240 [Penicillium expansum]
MEMVKLKTSIRNNLSPIDHDRPLRQIMKQRIPTTAEWFQKELVFDEWKDDPQTAILWCLGTIGMGKTVLMSHVVDQLRLQMARKTNDIVSYYFCRVDNEISLSARNILGSIARQVLNTQIEESEYETLLSLEESTRDLDTTDVVQFLLFHLKTGEGKKYYVALDGLDECDGNQVQAVAQAMVELCRKCIGFKILCSGRPGLEKRFQLTATQYKIMANEKKVKSDMDQYLTKTLDKCLEDRNLTLRDPEIIKEIYNTLRDKANGMFLWASLCIEELCAQNCDYDILEALKHLPRSLAELYDRKLRRVREGKTAGHAMKLLQYCGTVKRPLTVSEYQEALSLSLEQKNIDHRKVPNDMVMIINGCCGLTFVDEEEDTIHYVHRSVKERLFITNGPHTAQFEIASVNREFGFLCMVYLDFTDFKRQLTKFKNGSDTPIQPLQFATSTLPTHSSSRFTSKIAQKLLSHHRQLQHFSTREAIQWLLANGHFALLLYCARHQSHYLTEDLKDEILRGAAIHNRYRYTEAIIPLNNTKKILDHALSYAALDGCNRSLLALLKAGAGIDAQVNGRRALQTAAGEGHLELVQTLLEKKASVNAPPSRCGLTALQAAAGGGHLKVVQTLLAAKAWVDARGGVTALEAAAGGGHLNVVQALLAAKADVNLAPSLGGRTALQAAAGGGYLDVVQALLAAKADVNAPPSEGSLTALQAAAGGGYLKVVHTLLAAKAWAGGGHLNVVQALLAAKADVNAPPSLGGRTALQAAAGEGYLDVVQALLAAKAEVNAPPTKYIGRTALQAAAEGGYLDVVQALLEAKADVNAPPEYSGRTALQAAAGGGHLNVVQALLAAKADANAPPSERDLTALQAAAGGGHLNVVQVLLAARADVNASPSENIGRTALQAAAEGGYLNIVQELLAEKADVNAPPSRRGLTALQAAVGGGHLDVVQALLAAKADINAPPSKGGLTALQAAAGGGHLNLVQVLLAARADVNVSPSEVIGRTALQAAAEGGYLNIVQALLAEKADVNAPPSRRGLTALQAAAGGGHLDVVQALLAAKADINAPPSKGGLTALQAAAGGGHLNVVQALLAAKADVNAPPFDAEDHGQTALEVAQSKGHTEVVQALLAAGANVNAPSK